MSATIAIVGGGFSGAAAAVQLARRSAEPLAITIVEPRSMVGPGLAYSTDDPDHRLNGSVGTHLVDPADPDELGRWCETHGVLARDPEALAPNGESYLRRADFGAFVAETVATSAHAANGTTIRHWRDRAVGLRAEGDRCVVVAASGTTLAARVVVIATGNGGVRLPSPFAALGAHRALIADAADLPRVRVIPRSARVLVVGSGLTALDVVSTLVRGGHRGGITVVSRHGLRPRPARPATGETTGANWLARMNGEVPAFIADAAPTARALLHALRRRICETQAAGQLWYDAFDALRDVVWKVWPRLDVREKNRFLRWLRPWYDVHRFRAPPQNDAIAHAAEARGTLRFVRARLRDAAAAGAALRIAWVDPVDCSHTTQLFDAVVNCTGLDPACGAHDDPFQVGLVRDGLLRVDATGVGFAVDAQCRPIGANGTPHSRLRVVGPPTAGTFGDPLGTLFIAPQIARIVPGILAELGIACEHAPGDVARPS
ncbi:MAG: FAD/NAD(P)-binding protein [Rudaea sp.]